MILADITISEAAAIGLVIATIQFATLLYLAALGETIAERAGVLNLGVEGMMAVGAVTGYIAGAVSGSPWIGLLVGALGGALLASIHAFVAVGLGADQVVSGLALTILGLGLADYIGADYTGDSRRAWFADVDIPVLTDIPWVGETIFAADEIPRDPAAPADGYVKDGVSYDPWYEQDRCFIEDVRDSLAGRGSGQARVVNDYADGLQTLAPCLAAWESARRGGALIDVAAFAAAEAPVAAPAAAR